MGQDKVWKHCWWEYWVAWPFGKIIYLIKLNTCIFYDTAILVSEIHFEKLAYVYQVIDTVFVASLFTAASQMSPAGQQMNWSTYIYSNEDKQQLNLMNIMLTKKQVKEPIYHKIKKCKMKYYVVWRYKQIWKKS